jgi:cardiolipin synthase
MMGRPLSNDEVARREMLEPAGDVALRVVGGEPASAEMLRVDQLVATLARKRLWLTDAYYAGTFSYVQALRAAAEDGVDVRLLLPNASDIPFLRPLSRSGYRPLLEAGVRVFEWNGTMLHAKTAVADCMWARVGSTNLNVVSWFGNYELDVVIENVPFAREMEESYLHDLENATEIVLDSRHKVRVSKTISHPQPAMTSGGGSGGRAAAGALRLSNAVGAAFTNRRVLEPVEARLMVTVALLLMAFAVLIWFFPRVLSYPLIVLLVWISLALVYRAFKLHGQTRPIQTPVEQKESTKTAND